MKKYAFCFCYQEVDKDDMIWEYFRPYGPKELIKLVSSEYMKDMLERASIEGKTFEEFVEKYGLHQKDYIVDISEMRNRENAMWINDEHDLMELSLWDYIADARAVSAPIRTENSTIINHLATRTLQARIYFDYVKILLSILVYLDDEEWNVRTIDAPDLPLSPEEVEHLDRIIQIVYNGLLDKKKRTDSEFEIYEKIKEETEYIRSERESNILAEIMSYLSGKKKSYKKERIQRMWEELVIRVCNASEYEFEYKVEYYILLKPVGVLKNALDANTRPAAVLAVMNSYRQRDDSLDIGGIVDKLITRQELVAKYDCDTLLKLEMIHKVSEEFNNTTIKDFLKGKVGKKIINKYSKDESGCFLLLFTQKEKYFSLSGIADEKSSTKSRCMEELAVYIMKNIFEVKGKLCSGNVRNQTFEYNWCYLDQDTIRYTEIINNKNNIKYISSPQTYGDDLKNRRINIGDNKIIGNTYGCCERKVLGHSNLPIVKIIYCRWAPCSKCAPAVYYLTNCNFFAYAKNFREWVENGCKSELKRYAVNKVAAYEIV